MRARFGMASAGGMLLVALTGCSAASDLPDPVGGPVSTLPASAATVPGSSGRVEIAPSKAAPSADRTPKSGAARHDAGERSGTLSVIVVSGAGSSVAEAAGSGYSCTLIQNQAISQYSAGGSFTGSGQLVDLDLNEAGTTEIGFPVGEFSLTAYCDHPNDASLPAWQGTSEQFVLIEGSTESVRIVVAPTA
jgi:hypothetical protein